jgi:hypothetical protein
MGGNMVAWLDPGTDQEIEQIACGLQTAAIEQA